MEQVKQLDLPFSEKENKNQMNLETRIEAKFVCAKAPTPEEQIVLDQLNAHAEDICNRLQKTFYQLIIEILDVKREARGGN